MIGAIIGDIYGSLYSYEIVDIDDITEDKHRVIIGGREVKPELETIYHKPDNTTYMYTKKGDRELFEVDFRDKSKLKLKKKSRPWGNTYLVVAISRALQEFMDTHEDRILDSPDNDMDFYKLCIKNMKQIGKRYPHGRYDKRYKKWLNKKKKETYIGYVSDGALRAASIGWYVDSLEEALYIARTSAMPTHTHKEGIKGAQAVVAAIYLLRTGATKEELKSYIESTFEYDLDKSVDEIRKEFKYDTTCRVVVPEAFIAFLNSESFEDAILTALSLGGDVDNIAAITGAIAEAYYPIPDSLFREANDRIHRYTRLNSEDFKFYNEFITARKGGEPQIIKTFK